MALGSLDHRLFFDDATPPWWDPTAHTPAWQDVPDMVVVVDGELDAGTSPRLDRALAEICPEALERIVVNCEHMTFCDSHGLKVLLVHRDRFVAAGVRFQVASSPALEFVMDQVAERFETVPASTGGCDPRSLAGSATTRRFVRLGTPLA